jgi:hypothetical protein
LHATTTASAGSSLPQIACSADGAPIHALFPVARVPFALPKAFAVPVVAAIASVVPGSSFTPGFGAGGAYPIASASAPRTGGSIAGAAIQNSTPNLTLSGALTDATAFSAPLPLTGDEAITSPLLNTIAPGTDTMLADEGYPTELNVLTPAATAVPEPSTWWLFSSGAILLAVLRRRSRHGQAKKVRGNADKHR